MGFLAGKRLLITGLLNNRSIAYGVARACHREGAGLAFSYMGERFKDRMTEFAAEFGSSLIFDCDVSSDEQIDALAAGLKAAWPDGFDGFVHSLRFPPRAGLAGRSLGPLPPAALPSLGFPPREAIAGEFLDGLSREAFRVAHDISAYSFPALAKATLPQ